MATFVELQNFRVTLTCSHSPTVYDSLASRASRTSRANDETQYSTAYREMSPLRVKKKSLMLHFPACHESLCWNVVD